MTVIRTPSRASEYFYFYVYVTSYILRSVGKVRIILCMLSKVLAHIWAVWGLEALELPCTCTPFWQVSFVYFHLSYYTLCVFFEGGAYRALVFLHIFSK